jgi:uncharacterized protein YndB with AHSA1/START domain
MNVTQNATANRELKISRLINAPRELVFEAWTDPKHLAKWWGPNGCINTIQKMDVKKNGELILTMHTPDGTDYPNRIIYEEVVKPEKLVYSHDDGSDNDPRGFHVTVTFDAQGKKTFLTMHAVWKSVAAFAELAKFGAIEGGKQTLERLEAYVTAEM